MRQFLQLMEQYGELCDILYNKFFYTWNEIIVIFYLLPFLTNHQKKIMLQFYMQYYTHNASLSYLYYLSIANQLITIFETNK